MATATFDSAFLGQDAVEGKQQKTGIFSRFVAARQAEACRRVGQCLSTYSERQLEELGFTAKDVETLRKGKMIADG